MSDLTRWQERRAAVDVAKGIKPKPKAKKKAVKPEGDK